MTEGTNAFPGCSLGMDHLGGVPSRWEYIRLKANASAYTP